MIHIPSGDNFVIDANILFSCLISGKENYLTFFESNTVYVPDFLYEEIQLHQEVIRLKSKLAATEFRRYALAVFRSLIVIPNLLISDQHFYQAYYLCRDVDLKDLNYVALSIELNFPLLTRDKPLAEGLRAKGYTNVILLDELFGQ
ncbi:PIN domain-containing protein [Larkinella punicea]|jgi:predicted nucleic acid-binding protein|uniref:DNA-binding protein n=1 Tax=Larkinella punicea TaxID=2315727 RepID=A0A368JUR5_9BACT|nr:PIN domain-containing protein [Larkinella punicea]RCR71397.1 DNA-binding protein [Larkinella punicea]